MSIPSSINHCDPPYVVLYHFLPDLYAAPQADQDLVIRQHLYCFHCLADQFFTVRPDNPRAMDAGELAARIEAMGAKATACASVRDGVDRAIQAEGPHGVACALGSLYMSGEVRSCFGKN